MWNRCIQIFENISDPLRDEMKHIWLRDELPDNDRRTPLTPQDAKKLLDDGFQVCAAALLLLLTSLVSDHGGKVHKESIFG